MNESPERKQGGNEALLILGPTASGKSALALAAAQDFGGVVINADSMQVYRDLRIITARPDERALAAAPHRLYGFLDAAEICSAVRWAELAAGEVRAARAAGRLPIIVGGSGLYVRALLEGFSPIPDIDPAHRKAAAAKLAELGGERFRAELAGVDAASAARLHAGDSQRLIRAWEVWLGTGRPLSEWQMLPPEPPPLDPDLLKVVLLPDRKMLYERCDARFGEMLAQGAMAEVRALAARRLDPDLPAMKALGVPQLIAADRGEIGLETAAAEARTLTRRYAKRQVTWLRHQIISDITHDAQHMERMKADIFPKISEFLLTRS
ncbi:MAG: tRNA (adenosine(37)-N6)-dimethylallyltransferase MiaA [Rhizobiales bacterium NRL2]|jgi:tRNA dimethylallyltransferase|nr:MAG: tRNA (adenosine(37)-N6)-dimethylallyltransferase MiaA [Rhizobiales bacterium NRL2]